MGVLSRLAALLLALSLTLSAPVRAGDSFANVQRNLFVSGRDRSVVAVVNIDAGRVVGRLDLGLVPRQMAVSESLAKLAGADGRTAQVAVVELASGSVSRLPVPLTPTRLLVSPDGLTLAAIADESGQGVLIDLLLMRETGRLAGPSRVRDAMFSGDGKTLFVAADGAAGVVALDVAGGRAATLIPGAPAGALARSPNGREGFALAAGEVIRFELKSLAVLDRVAAPGVAALFPTGTGRFLMLPAAEHRALRLAPAQPLSAPLELRAAAGVSEAYSAWFDTVAFVPSRAERKLLVYDLETTAPAASIALGGEAGPGVVTPDGGKLYLPLGDRAELAVIDAAQRRRAASIPLDFPPVAAVMAGGYGICH